MDDNNTNESYIIDQLDALINESHHTVRQARACIVDLYRRNTNLQSGLNMMTNSFNSLEAHDFEASEEAIKLRRILHGVVTMVNDSMFFRVGHASGDAGEWEEAIQILGMEDSQYDVDDF